MTTTKKKIFTYLGATVIVLVVAAVIAALSVNNYRDNQRKQETAAGTIIAACALSKMSLEAKQKIAADNNGADIAFIQGYGSGAHSEEGTILPQLIDRCEPNRNRHWHTALSILPNLLDQDAEYTKIADALKPAYEVAVENERKKQGAREEEQKRINSWMFKDSQTSK